MKYIDAEKLIAEIERQIEEEKNNITEETELFYGARQQVRSKILRIITSLQWEPIEWSEEDEKMLQRIIRYTESEYQDWCNDKYGNSEIVSDGKRSCLERLDWLENRLKSLRPQPKQEWSEEDEKMLNSILDEYKSMVTEKRNWLKSIPERFNLQPKQKWNEENWDKQ
jgi:hypothetical protein